MPTRTCGWRSRIATFPTNAGRRRNVWVENTFVLMDRRRNHLIGRVVVKYSQLSIRRDVVRSATHKPGKAVASSIYCGAGRSITSLLFSTFLAIFPDRNRPKPNAAFSNRRLNRGCRFFEKAAIFA